MNFLADLNTAQQEPAEHIEGPLMIIAGAGSGKTRVLTYRIANLLDKGIDPFNILALTFTNKAAREMKNRIETLIGSTEAKSLWMGTFHSIFARILRSEAEKIGYPRNYSIYDTSDSRSLIRTIIKELQLDDKIYKPASVLGRISGAKNKLISWQEYKADDALIAIDNESRRPEMARIYENYDQRLYKAGALDFDDLLFKTNILFRDFNEVLYKYQQMFHFILVDEYQDTNYSQYLICKKLAALRENICVVGDDAQSIYAFRGADIQNILNFKQDYPDYSLYKLEQNYRSTKNIVNAANSVIKENKTRIKKDIWTDNVEGDLVQVVESKTDNAEGSWVGHEIFNIKMNNQAKENEFAILYRTNAQSRIFEEVLRKLNIPYKIYGGLSFYQRKEIKDLLSYFRLVVNPQDEEAFKRIINYPRRGIGQTTLDKLFAVAAQKQMSIWDLINTHNQQLLTIINSGTLSKLNKFELLINSFRNNLKSKSAFELGNDIAKASGILGDLYSDKSQENISKIENIEELMNALKEFADKKTEEDNTLTDFLVEVALLTDADEKDKENSDHVSLMTVHASKGLEYPYIFIVGMEENLFPSQLFVNSRKELEEERRLFYVAITRAMKKVYLTYATSRFRWGNVNFCEPSRFIDEIDKKFVEFQQDDVFIGNTKSDYGNRNKKVLPNNISAKQPSIFGKKLKKVNSRDSGNTDVMPVTDITVGVQVEHNRFGKGKVIAVEGIAPNIRATVYFPSSGQKQLLLKYAKLTVLN